MTTLIAIMLTPVTALPNEVAVAVYAYTKEDAQRIQAADIVLGWEPADLRLIGLDNAGAIDTTCSCIPPSAQDYTGANEADPPSDGDAIMWWLGPLTGIPVYISEPALLTTVRFERLRPFESTEVRLIPSVTHAYPATTIVYGSDVPGSNVTGTLTNAFIAGRPADLDMDGEVGPSDLSIALSEWAGAETLALILSSWGPCP